MLGVIFTPGREPVDLDRIGISLKSELDPVAASFGVLDDDPAVIDVDLLAALQGYDQTSHLRLFLRIHSHALRPHNT